MAAKDRHKENLLTFLGNPENEFPKRKDYPVILRVSKKTLYKHFDSDELTEIENEAYEIRKATSSRQRANVLDAMYKRAIGFSHPDIHISNFQGEITKTDIIKVYPPDKSAAQEFFDRTEGKITEKKEITGKDGAPIETKSTLEAGPGVSKVLQALEEATTEGQDTGDEGGNQE